MSPLTKYNPPLFPSYHHVLSLSHSTGPPFSGVLQFLNNPLPYKNNYLKDKKPYQKPLRKFIYCYKMSRNLTRHMKTRHKDVQRVKGALLMKKERRIIEFQKIRREGIRLYNEREVSKKHPVFQGERKQGKYKKLTQCSAYLAFLSRRFFSLHK